MFAVIIPVYNNAGSLPGLLGALAAVDETLYTSGEAETCFVFVVDGSPDESADVLRQSLPDCPFKSELLIHSRNFGSFAAIRTGLGAVEADAYAMIAADLQEPPDLLVRFHEALKGGAHDVAIGVREGRDDPAVGRVLSETFWSIYRRLVMPAIPRGGVDLFGCTVDVRNELLGLDESHSSLVAQLFWLGFSRVEIPYTRVARRHGKSGWSLSKKLRYMMDSIFAFTDIPIRLISLAGILAMALSVLYGGYVLIARAAGSIADPGFATTIIAILFMGGLNAFALGIVGNYAWRTFENSKQRPLSVVARQWSFPRGQARADRGDDE